MKLLQSWQAFINHRSAREQSGIYAAVWLMGLVLFGILLNIVGKTIMVLLFGEQLTEENTAPASREAILKMMIAFMIFFLVCQMALEKKS